MPPAPSCARNRYSPITRGSSAASGFISSPRVRSRASHSALYLAKPVWPMNGKVAVRPSGSRLVAVPHPRFGEQVAGTRRVVLQLATQPRHVEPEVVGALTESRAPYRGQQLRRPDQLPGPLEQDLKEPPLGRREPERVPRVVAGRPPDLM